MKLMWFLSKCREKVKSIETIFKIASLTQKRSHNYQEADNTSYKVIYKNDAQKGSRMKFYQVTLGITLGCNVNGEFLSPASMLADISCWDLTSGLHTEHTYS